jgi:hypothetical protein
MSTIHFLSFKRISFILGSNTGSETDAAEKIFPTTSIHAKQYSEQIIGDMSVEAFDLYALKLGTIAGGPR